MIENIKKDARIRMSKTLDSLRTELAKIRTGRAHPSLLEHVQVDYYGSNVPISQAANVTIEDARTLAVTAWDKSMVQAAEKAIRESGLGINPQLNGTIIMLPIPELNEERRRDLTRVAAQYAESARVSVRNVRQDGMQQLKRAKDGMSEDDNKMWHDEVQEMTDKYVAVVDKALETKQEEIMQV